MNILVVTACAAGVAHTYMAAESIQNAGLKRGHQIKVETQGATGIENRLSADDVKNADVIVLTNDIPIRERERFNSKRIFNVTSTDCIKSANKIIEAIEQNCK